MFPHNSCVLYIIFHLVVQLSSSTYDDEAPLKETIMDISSLPVPVANTSVLQAPISVPEKLLMGPGPSNCAPKVLESLSLPVLGHMHKEFFQILDEIKLGLQYVFQTTNKWTLVISGPGHAGMEASLVNLLEPGDTVVVGNTGIWGVRVADLVNRLGGVAVTIDKPLGKSVTLPDIQASLEKNRPKILFLVHSESSTGIMQSLEGVGDLCRSYGALLIVDTVASLGGVPFSVDQLKIDVCYSGSQKVLGAPPGLSPITFGPRAVEAIKSRTTPIKSYLLDMNFLSNYWDCSGGEPRGYHHTPPVNLLYGLREGLAAIASEELPNVWERHAKCAQRLYEGLRALGLELFIEEPANRLPTVTTVQIPPGVDWKSVTQYAMDKHLLEIAGGLGPTVGLVWRIGIMGYNAYPEVVDRVLEALKKGVEFSKLQGRL